MLDVDGQPELARAWQSPDGTVTIRAESAAGAERLRWILALDDDHSDFLRRVRDDPMLGRASRALRGLRPVRVATVAQALLRAFCGQLIEAKRARRLEQTIIRDDLRRRRRAAAPRADDARPRGARAVAAARARAPRAARGASLVRLCRTIELERLHDVPTGAVAARLERERGLGPWSVGVVCLEGLGRYDYGLVGDLGLVKLLRALRGRPVEGWETAELLEPYGEWAGPRERVPARRLLARAAAGRRVPRRVTSRHASDIAILGGGRIGEALLSGLLSSGWSDIVVTARREERVAELHERHGVEATTSNRDAVRRRRARRHRREAAGHRRAARARSARLLSPEQTVLSVAAAIPTAYIEARIADGVPVVRAMPNAPSTVHEGMAGIAAGAHAGDEQLALAEDVLTHLGRVVRVPENAMDAITAALRLRARVLRAARRGDDRGGHPARRSRARSRRRSSCRRCSARRKQLRDEKMHPVELRESVTSPGGTTIAAIRELEQAGVRAAFLNAIQAAMTRATRARRGWLGTIEIVVAERPRAASSRSGSPTRRASGGHIVLTGGSTPRQRVRARGRARARLERASSSGGATSAACRQTTSARTTAWRRRRSSTASRTGAVHRMRGELGRDEGARVYEQELGALERFDLVLLGLGPRRARRVALSRRSRRSTRPSAGAIGAEAKLEPFVDRITLTLPMLRRAQRGALPRHRRGQGGRRAGARSRASRRASTPGSLVRAVDGRTTAVLDAAAAALL